MTIYDEVNDYLFHTNGGKDPSEEEVQEEILTGLNDAFLFALYLEDVRYTPYLLRKFISLHLKDALEHCEQDVEFIVASRIMEEIERLPEPYRSLTLHDLQEGHAPSISVLKRICFELEQERLYKWRFSQGDEIQ